MPKPIFVIHGIESVLRSRALSRLVDEVVGGEKDALGYSEYEGDSVDLAEVLDDVRTGSLLGGGKLVVVSDADSFVTANRSQLEDFLEQPPTTASLALVVKSWPSNTRLAKKVAQIGESFNCERPKAGRVAQILAQEARTEFDKTLSPGAAHRLHEFVGDDLTQLFSELAKVCTYVGARPKIEANDVEDVCTSWQSENIFQITDAIADGDAARALRSWRQLNALDAAAQFRALGGLGWGFRKLLQGRAMFDQGVPARRIMSDLRVFRDARDFERRLNRFTTAKLRSCLNRLLEADYASKTGLGDVARHIEKLIVGVAEGR